MCRHHVYAFTIIDKRSKEEAMNNLAWGTHFSPQAESALASREQQAERYLPTGDVVTIMVVDREKRTLVAETTGAGANRRRWALVQGGMLPKESPIGAAQRWLQQQTGCAAADWRYLGSCDAYASRQGRTAHFFIAQKVYETNKPPVDDVAAAYHWIPLGELRQALWDGCIDGQGAAANIALGLLSLS